MDKKSKYDWQKIRLEYVTSPSGDGEVTLSDLCKKYGCKKSIIGERSAREDWPELRRLHRINAVTKAEKKAEETSAERLHRHAKLMRVIQASGIKAIQNKDTKATPRDIIEAAKTERVLYGEAAEHVKVDSPHMTPEKAAALWKATAKFDDNNMEEEEKAK